MADKMADKKIEVYANFTVLHMYNVGIENGLSRTAAHFFSHYTDKKLILTVDTETGEVKKAQCSN